MARSIDGDCSRAVGARAAAPEICRVDERGAFGIQLGDERSASATAQDRLESSGGGRKVGRGRSARDVSLARCVDGDAHAVGICRAPQVCRVDECAA